MEIFTSKESIRPVKMFSKFRFLFRKNCKLLIAGITLMLEYGFAWTGIERTVEEKAECVVQFLDKNIALNVLCAMAAFFLPATIMCGLYLRLVLTNYLYKYSNLME